MAKFTVIGLYEDSGQVFADYVKAENAYEAIRLVALKWEDAPEDLQILGAIQGERHLYPACEDSGKAAFAIDLY
jgi:hypothetical protein